MEVKRKLGAALGALTLAVMGMGALAIPAAATPATPPDDGKCYEWVDDTYKDIPNPDYVPAADDTYTDTPGKWSNFEPNDEQGVFTGPPVWPTDDRGTWSDEKTDGGPQQDAVGVYQNGNGNGSWFHRGEATHVNNHDGHGAIGEPTLHVIDVAGHNVEVACPPADDDDDYVTVAWRMPSWTGTGATWPQTIQSHQGTDEPELNVLDGTLPDGCYQIDVYHDSQTTTNLILGGHLEGPNTPPEDLISGSEGTAWKFVKVGEGECNPVDEPDVASATWTGTPPSCLDLDGSGEFTFENATVTSAFRAGDDVDYASGFHAGTHEDPFDGVWTVTLTANEGAVFAGGSTTKVLEFTIDRLTAEECVVTPPPVCSTTEDTSHWQRYSWVGGPIPEGVTPEFLGADDPNWQANTASDPHKIGHAGAYDRGKPGNADWFYLEWVDQPPCPTATGIPFSVTPEPASCTAPGSFDAASLGGVYNEETGRWEFENVNVEVIFDGDQVTLNVFAHEGFVIDPALLDPDAGWFVEEGGARASVTITLDPQLDANSEGCVTDLPVPVAFNAEPSTPTCLAPAAFDLNTLGTFSHEETFEGQLWREYIGDHVDVWALIESGRITLYIYADYGFQFTGLSDAWDVEDGRAATRTIDLPAQLSGEAACPTTHTTTPPPPESLSHTGFDGMGGLYGSAALLLAGATLLVTRRLANR